ncbi:MAG: RHS repeat-associated core domain-containing protein, partial [Bryobacteraceae bacterium]
MPTDSSAKMQWWFTSKERDAETGLDWFEARYFSGPQGRFTSPDDPFAGQDPSNPQSWNLFSYGLNNPLRFIDPDGHEPCENGVNPQNGNICAVATAKKPETETNKSALPTLVLNVMVTTVQVLQRTQELSQPLLDFVSRPRDSGCLA